MCVLQASATGGSTADATVELLLPCLLLIADVFAAVLGMIANQLILVGDQSGVDLAIARWEH